MSEIDRKIETVGLALRLTHDICLRSLQELHLKRGFPTEKARFHADHWEQCFGSVILPLRNVPQLRDSFSGSHLNGL